MEYSSSFSKFLFPYKKDGLIESTVLLMKTGSKNDFMMLVWAASASAQQA